MIKFFNKQFNFPEFLTGLLFVYISMVFFSMAISNIILGLVVLIFIISFFFKKIELNFSRQNWKIYILIIVPFLLTVISSIYSENSSKAMKFIWLRIPVLIIPFILIFTTGIKAKMIKKGFLIFLFSTIIASLITLYNAYRYINEGVLFVTDFSFLITIIQHPYFGIFVLITLVSIVEFNLIKNKLLKALVFILLGLVIAITTSRMVYLLFAVIITIYLFRSLTKRKALIVLTLLSVIAGTFIITNKSIVTKFKTTYQYNNSPRLKLWNNAYKVVTNTKSVLFGIGIGDFYEDKKDVYFFEESEKGVFGYNPHSQVIEFFTTNGLIGSMIVLLTLILGIKKINNQNRFAVLVFSIIITFSLTETILNRQIGVQLYAFFIPLIFKENFKKK